MTSVLTRTVSRGILTPTLMVALGILVKGYGDVGDGFAAGIVAALGVLLQFVAFGRAEVAAALPIRHAPVLALVGLGIGVAIFAGGFLFGGAPLEHWPPAGQDPVYVGSVELITAVAFDVGVFLLVLGAAITIIDALAAPRSAET